MFRLNNDLLLTYLFDNVFDVFIQHADYYQLVKRVGSSPAWLHVKRFLDVRVRTAEKLIFFRQLLLMKKLIEKRTVYNFTYDFIYLLIY